MTSSLSANRKDDLIICWRNKDIVNENPIAKQASLQHSAEISRMVLGNPRLFHLLRSCSSARPCLGFLFEAVPTTNGSSDVFVAQVNLFERTLQAPSGPPTQTPLSRLVFAGTHSTRRKPQQKLHCPSSWPGVAQPLARKGLLSRWLGPRSRSKIALSASWPPFVIKQSVLILCPWSSRCALPPGICQ